MSIRSRSAVAAVVPLIVASMIGLTAAPPAFALPDRATEDLVDRLEALPGVTVVSEEAAPAPGTRFFLLTYRQPVDHTNPAGRTFEQRFQLLHRGEDRPVVLHNTGYHMPEVAFRAEPTGLLDANQISVEQRYFSPSRPEPADWSKLTIWQAATDHHRIVGALKSIYSARWISTGASKGGMASVYHRRFYPRDVDGTVAYVAPNDADNRDDTAYENFFDTVGTPFCRDALRAFQREALIRRTELVAMYEAFAAANGLTFDEIHGTPDRAFEATVILVELGFWQTENESACPAIPTPDASDQEIFDYLNWVVGLFFSADESIEPYIPYYHQAATQLGWPQRKFTHLRDLLRYRHLDAANASLPEELRSRHDPHPMSDVDSWVSTDARRVLFVYGDRDPWSAERFQPSRKDSYAYTAANASHRANIELLDPADRAAATAALLRWAEVDAPAADPSADLAELDRHDHVNRHLPAHGMRLSAFG